MFNEDLFIRKVLVYQNGNLVFHKNVKNAQESMQVVSKYFEEKDTTLQEALKILSIKLYFVILSRDNIQGTITRILPSGKLKKKETAVLWYFKGNYKNNPIDLELIDTGDFVYTFWDLLEIYLAQKNITTIKDLDFKISVKSKKDVYTEKQKLILFFSNKQNCGKQWKYADLTEAMRKEGLEMVGRGIGGERAREFRYMLGYPFITSEQNKNVQDGYCTVEHPFPTMERNERRNPNVTLKKEDWSELLDLLGKDPKKLRCYSCGLFKGETNKIGQKTKFEKGHMIALTAGGDISEENIMAICKYCNSEQKNIFSYEPKTGKKIYHLIPFMKDQKYQDKLKVLEYLLKHIKEKDARKIVIDYLKT